jgi:hypothetical protein
MPGMNLGIHLGIEEPTTVVGYQSDEFFFFENLALDSRVAY